MLGDKKHIAEDTLLLSQLRDGNVKAFDCLYDKYKKEVFNEAYKRLNNKELAKDVVQDIFTALWIIGSEKIINNLPGYLYIATKNNVLRLMQKESRFVAVPELLAELYNFKDRADAAIIYKELIAAYDALVTSLPNQQKIIYQMRYDEKLSSDEIAQRLNISPKTVRNQLGRVLARLKTTFIWLQIIIWATNRY